VTGFEAAVVAAAEALGPAGLRRLADRIQAGGGVGVVESADAAVAISRVLEAALTGQRDPEDRAAFVRGVAAGYEHRAAQVLAEVVWTGPTTFDVPVRATAQALLQLVAQARYELILATYSARPYPALVTALRAAVERGVDVWIVVETLHGAGSAIQGEQPAKAFLDVSGVSLWTWAVDRRPEGAKMHAKLAVTDARTLFVSSANLTSSGIDSNIEAGVLVHGGSAARRTAEHLWGLRGAGLLVRI
jgi:phosphatidylserine/phosphatidylglycerophosphate/cardiolipin synthase-like enzyme